MKTAMLTETATGRKIRVHATTEHPDFHYGHAVWVDDDGVAYFEVGAKFHDPNYSISDIKEEDYWIVDGDPHEVRSNSNAR